MIILFLSCLFFVIYVNSPEKHLINSYNLERRITMINSQIGYIICESVAEPMETSLTPKTINGKVVAEGILQTADERNRNGRYYSKEELFPQLTAPRTLELLEAGYLRAETGHPLSKDLQRQSTSAPLLVCSIEPNALRDHAGLQPSKRSKLKAFPY